MRKNISLIIVFSFLIGHDIVFAQACAVVSYTYDACGNRIKRSLQVQPCSFNARIGPIANSKDSIEIDDVKEIKVFPNPTAENLNVEWENDSVSTLKELTLIDITGKIISVFQIPEGDETLKLDLVNQKSGIYTLQLVFTDNKKKYYKVIKN